MAGVLKSSSIFQFIREKYSRMDQANIVEDSL